MLNKQVRSTAIVYIDELATYQCFCAVGELSDVQTTLLTAIVDKFSTAGSFVTMATLKGAATYRHCACSHDLVT